MWTTLSGRGHSFWRGAADGTLKEGPDVLEMEMMKKGSQPAGEGDEIGLDCTRWF